MLQTLREITPAGALLSQRLPTMEVLPGSRLRIVDRTSISRAGDHGTTWRIHASFDPSTACFTDRSGRRRKVQPVLVCARRFGY